MKSSSSPTLLETLTPRLVNQLVESGLTFFSFLLRIRKSAVQNQRLVQWPEVDRYKSSRYQ